ncbi:MAG TPA: bifunctional riboflavin kinase/FMN adenylyltransferase [Planctomycetota bacterium]|nr:bifunctional riboflavin kinase/FMN adenylyltransferase [Planctomycetota bacterium]
MNTVRGLFAPVPRLAAPVATLGAFDGVHRGHQRILAETVAWARDAGGQAVVLTFDPLPKAVVGPGGALCITSLPHRLALMQQCGLDLAVVVPFDATVAEMPAERFVRDVLLGWIGARRVVFGRDSTFGRKAEGDLALLRRLEADGLLAVRSPAPVRYRGGIISSTAIRQAIGAGGLRAAAAMLGRPFSLLGTVVRGEGRGRSLGFPTANLDLHHEAIPPDGVYATLAHVPSVAGSTDTGKMPVPPERDSGGTGFQPVGGGGEGGAGFQPVHFPAYPALTYVGRRPTFAADDAATSIEVHVIGLEADLYGLDIEVRFVRRLRGDQRFPSADALVAQMEADRRAALRACRAALRRTRPGPTTPS